MFSSGIWPKALGVSQLSQLIMMQLDVSLQAFHKQLASSFSGLTAKLHLVPLSSWVRPGDWAPASGLCLPSPFLNVWVLLPLSSSWISWLTLALVVTTYFLKLFPLLGWVRFSLLVLLLLNKHHQSKTQRSHSTLADLTPLLFLQHRRPAPLGPQPA